MSMLSSQSTFDKNAAPDMMPVMFQVTIFKAKIITIKKTRLVVIIIVMIL